MIVVRGPGYLSNMIQVCVPDDLASDEVFVEEVKEWIEEFPVSPDGDGSVIRSIGTVYIVGDE